MTNSTIIESPPGVVFKLSAALDEHDISRLATDSAQEQPSVLLWVDDIPVQLIAHGGFLETEMLEVHTTTATSQPISQAVETIESWLVHNHAVTNPNYVVEILQSSQPLIESVKQLLEDIKTELQPIFVEIQDKPVDLKQDIFHPPFKHIATARDHLDELDQIFEELDTVLAESGIDISVLDENTVAYNAIDSLLAMNVNYKEIKRALAIADPTIGSELSHSEEAYTDFRDSLPTAIEEIGEMYAHVDAVCATIEDAEANGTSID